MTTYFFRHSFVPNARVFRGPIPGRCLFSVRGPSLRREGNAFTPKAAAAHRVCVDGFAENGPGPNVDPNVLAAELPWFLSFCRASAHVQDLERNSSAVGGAKTLGMLVRPGDLIVFGEPYWAAAIAIDTVLCVGEVVQLPVRTNTAGKVSFSLETDFKTYWAECMAKGLVERDLSWPAFVASPDFVLNLADSLGSERAAELLGHVRETCHPEPEVVPSVQIVGRRCLVSQNLTTAELVERFAGGGGFDFIPLGTPAAWRQFRLATRRPGVFIAPFDEAKRRLRPKGPGQPSIFRLGHAEGRALQVAILSQAEELVHGPLSWTAPRRFSHFEDARPVYAPIPDGRDV